MTKTLEEKALAEKRKRERERKAVQRAAARAKGIPEAGHVSKAIVEATAYAMHMSHKSLWEPQSAWGPINAYLIIAVATDLLVDRGGYDRKVTKRAIVDALKPRPSWKDTKYSPTVDVETAARRYRLAPPSWVTCRPRNQ